jgi:uncharacterized membrane protein
MLHLHHKREWSSWAIPLAYSFGALVLAFVFPRFEHRWFPRQAVMSVSSAVAIYSSIASGTIALTAIVFSLAFVMVQFSSTAYSPRLVVWVARDPFQSHAIGVFTATFLYALGAIAWVDRGGNGGVPVASAWSVVVLLIASIVMFVGLIQRIGLLQVSRMLSRTGDLGRDVIGASYVHTLAEPRPHASMDAQELVYHGRPQALQALDLLALAELAAKHSAAVEVVPAVGDTVGERNTLARVFGAVIPGARLIKTFHLGRERTMEQDPKYALRLLVDIAIKALSPAINDPTTAVQALDQIEDLLVRLGLCDLDIGHAEDRMGVVRVVFPVPNWDDFLSLALDEILYCGATSVQVMRRMKALIADLIHMLPEPRHATLQRYQRRVDASIGRSFPDLEAKICASTEDRQGLGVSHRDSSSAALH